MPIECNYYDHKSVTKIRRDWNRHYIGKGCHKIKANRLAGEKAKMGKTCPF